MRLEAVIRLCCREGAKEQRLRQAMMQLLGLRVELE